MAAVLDASAVPLLELRNVDAAYGPFRAIFGVSFALSPGRVLAMLGSNGAGKTTVARVASGLLAPTRGIVLFDGEDVSGWRPYRYARLGVVHAPEGRSVFASLSVEENLALTFYRTRGRPHALPEGILPIHSCHKKPRHPASIGNCMQCQDAPRVNRKRVSGLADRLI